MNIRRRAQLRIEAMIKQGEVKWCKNESLVKMKCGKEVG